MPPASNGNEDSRGSGAVERTGDAESLAGRLTRGRLAWRRWRRTRPFWGGLLVILGGAEILASQKAPLPVVVHIGLQGLAGYLIPLVMVLCGLLLLFHPIQQTFYSILAVILALGSWVTSNLGGFFAGMLLGVVGGSLAFAWQQRDRRAPGKRRRRPRPRDEPSAGLALIRADPAENTEAAGQAAGGPWSGPGAADTEPTFEQPGSGPPPGSANDGPGPGVSRWGATVILAVPLAFSILAAPVLRLTAPAASASPNPAMSSQAPLRNPSVSRTGVPTASPAPSASPAPTASPAPSASPTPAASRSVMPSPGPTRRHVRHLAHAGTPAMLAASARCTLTAGSAVLTGLSFDGIATVRTTAGTVPMLKFSMSALTLSGGIVFLIRGGGHTYTDGDSSLEFAGDVVFYTTKISGDLHGSRVTFGTHRPPSRDLPRLALTNVVVDQPYTTADSLYASGYRISHG